MALVAAFPSIFKAKGQVVPLGENTKVGGTVDVLESRKALWGNVGIKGTLSSRFLTTPRWVGCWKAVQADVGKLD